MNHTQNIRVLMLITDVILQNPKRSLARQISGQMLRPRLSSWGGHHELNIVESNISPAEMWFRFFFPELQGQFSVFINNIWKKQPAKQTKPKTQQAHSKKCQKRKILNMWSHFYSYRLYCAQHCFGILAFFCWLFFRLFLIVVVFFGGGVVVLLGFGFFLFCFGGGHFGYLIWFWVLCFFGLVWSFFSPCINTLNTQLWRRKNRGSVHIIFCISHSSVSNS